MGQALQRGRVGLDDAPRSGRPVTDADDAQDQVIAKARSVPPQPDGDAVPPTYHWTLDRLQEALAKEGVPIKRSQIRRLLKAEHVKWQRPHTWLASDDPAFVERRGAIVRRYGVSPPGSTVIGVHECGPLAARRSPPGGTWAYGVLKHCTGEVLIETAETREPPPGSASSTAWKRSRPRARSIASPTACRPRRGARSRQRLLPPAACATGIHRGCHQSSRTGPPDSPAIPWNSP